MNNYSKTLKELLSEAMETKDLTIDKLADLTDISKRYLISIYNGDFKNMPAAPYVRGYLAKISQVLGMDAEILWQAYKNEQPLKSPGSSDKMPSNRFAIRGFNKKFWAVAIILVLVIIYFVWRVSGFFGTPSLEITSPVADNFIVSEPLIKLSGNVNPSDKLMINDEEIAPDSNGRFEKDFSLQSGPNAFEFKIKRFLGKEIKIIRQVIYQQ